MGGSSKDGGPYYFCYTIIQMRERKERALSFGLVEGEK